MRINHAIVLLALIGLSFQRSTPADDHYVAAVVEYMVDRNGDHNRVNYWTLIQQAAVQNADVIVFPEMTLTNGTTNVTVPIHGMLKQYPIPALNPEHYDDLLVAISAAARQNMIYVVINIREKMECDVLQVPGEDCPEEKTYFFNTNVVFDRNGSVIDRYRKINLFGEANHTPALKPDLGIFTTDFGVTFGHYVCFDLLFQVPSTQLVQEHKIKDIIFTTMWFSELPYLTAVQIQQSFAYTMDVNFLASGANNVRVGSAGSGIYSGKAGALASTMPGSPTRKLLVAKVPKVPGMVNEIQPGPIYDSPATLDNLLLKQDPSMTAHLTRPIVEGFQELTIDDKEISCRFRVNMTNRIGSENIYKYRAAALSGVRTHSGFANTGSRICAVVACTGDTKDTCGVRFPTYEENSVARFEELTVIGTMPTPVVMPAVEADDSVVFPISLKVSIMPLEVRDFTYTKTVTGNVTVHTLTLNARDERLYTFGLWGRLFTTDDQDVHPPVDDPSSSISHMLSRGLFISMLVLLGYNYMIN